MYSLLGNILCDIDSNVKGKKAGICDGVPSTTALVSHCRFKHIQASMVALVTCKNVEDPLKMKALKWSQQIFIASLRRFFQTLKGS